MDDPDGDERCNTCGQLVSAHGNIETLEGDMRVCPGTWVVGPGAKGEFWPVRDDIFQATYERVE